LGDSEDLNNEIQQSDSESLFLPIKDFLVDSNDIRQALLLLIFKKQFSDNKSIINQQESKKKLILEGKCVNKNELKLFKQIFDQKNDRVTRNEFFSNNLVQKLWVIFAESGVLQLYLNAVLKKYGSE
jgi:hypothetical protein